MLYERIFRSFDQAELRYAVIGGIAVNLHGYNRLTGDLDIIISLADENITKFIAIVRALGLVPRMPVELEEFASRANRELWIEEKNLKVFTVYNPQDPLEHVDVKIDRPEEIDPFLDRAISIQAGDINISLVTLDDLIALKRQAGRDRDLVDIKALERLRNLED